MAPAFQARIIREDCSSLLDVGREEPDCDRCRKPENSGKRRALPSLECLSAFSSGNRSFRSQCYVNDTPNTVQIDYFSTCALLEEAFCPLGDFLESETNPCECDSVLLAQLSAIFYSDIFYVFTSHHILHHRYHVLFRHMFSVIIILTLNLNTLYQLPVAMEIPACW